MNTIVVPVLLIVMIRVTVIVIIAIADSPNAMKDRLEAVFMQKLDRLDTSGLAELPKHYRHPRKGQPIV